MSTLKANTLSNVAGTKSIPTDTVADGTARAWASVNQSGTQALRDGFNVSSVVDGGVGTTAVNFNAAIPNANYAAIASSDNYCAWTALASYTVASVGVYNANNAGTLADGYVQVAVHSK